MKTGSTINTDLGIYTFGYFNDFSYTKYLKYPFKYLGAQISEISKTVVSHYAESESQRITS